MITPTKPTFESLFSDFGAFDEDAVLPVLLPLVTIQKSTNIISIREPKLTAKQKILAYSLVKKFLKFKAVIDNEMVTTNEIIKAIGLKRGTVDPLWQLLKSDGFLLGKGECEIPTSKVPEILKLLTSY